MAIYLESEAFMLSDLIHRVLDFIVGLGHWGIMLGLAVEIIPSEVVLAYAGYLIGKGDIGYVEAIVFAILGNAIAQTLLYWIGRYGGRPFVEKYGKFLHLSGKHLDLAENWFRRYGTVTIFAARFVPVVRQAISIPAGMARMSMWRFHLYTLLAMIPWSILFIQIGKSLGENWQDISNKEAPFTKIILAVIVVLAVVYILWKWRSRRTKRPEAAGYVGERNVAHALQRLGGDYAVLNGLRVKARDGVLEFDHIVIGPYGVFHLETKNWDGDIHIQDSTIGHGRDGRREEIKATQERREHALRELLRGNKLEAEVIGVVCFSHPGARLTGTGTAALAVTIDRLVDTIRHYRTNRQLSGQEVRAIAKMIQAHGERMW